MIHLGDTKECCDNEVVKTVTNFIIP
jgi:hypothetical protein